MLLLRRELPTRLGTRSFGHALTTFNHVKVPGSALLGSLRKPADTRAHFLNTIWRVGIGSLSLTSTIVPALKMVAYTTAIYSMRRCITGLRNKPTPIISFRTQQIPILHALAQGYVLDALYQRATEWFMKTPQEDINRRNAIATIVKATMIGHWRRTGCMLSDRCGAQGLFDHNHLICMEVCVSPLPLLYYR